MEFVENAYAKVNLHLEILDKRADGYHNIFSLMLSAEESDLLKLDSLDVTDREGPIEVDIRPGGGRYDWQIAAIPVHDNLVSDAVRAYFRKAGKSCRVILTLEKNIPAGAGLGGGSSDAAAMLRILNSQLALFNEAELLRMASSVGADVPYCLYGGCALCESIGDVVTRLEGALDYWILIANNNIHIDTGKAYGALKRSTNHDYDRKGVEDRRKMFAEGVGRNDLECFRGMLKNDFETVIFKDHPGLAVIKDSMLKCGADYASMTGSGSSIIGMFRDYDVIREAEQKMKKEVRQIILSRVI